MRKQKDGKLAEIQGHKATSLSRINNGDNICFIENI